MGGIALAFLLELYLNQTLKHPIKVEKRLRLPLFLTIPDTAQNGFRVPLAENEKRFCEKRRQTNPGKKASQAGRNEQMEIVIGDQPLLAPLF